MQVYALQEVAFMTCIQLLSRYSLRGFTTIWLDGLSARINGWVAMPPGYRYLQPCISQYMMHRMTTLPGRISSAHVRVHDGMAGSVRVIQSGTSANARPVAAARIAFLAEAPACVRICMRAWAHAHVQ